MRLCFHILFWIVWLADVTARPSSEVELHGDCQPYGPFTVNENVGYNQTY